ncbi:MAG TPA: hypothetical protein VL225_07640 [Vicinamibacterales bacterium]|jgi:uncharacterized membrane protein|nr:hypothetical protein [Vicinamibacterales bacterium]
MKRYAVAAVVILLVVVPWRSTLRADAVSYTVEDLGTIDGLVPAVTGINASGQISGYVNGPTGPRAVRYTDGFGWEYLPGLGVGSIAYAINGHGDLTGSHSVGSGTRAFRFRDGLPLEDIEPPAGSTATIGAGINEAGVVVGYSDTPDGGLRGWRASPGLPAQTLPTLGGTFAMTCGINTSGQIAGTSTTATGAQHAYRINVDDTTDDATSFDGPSGISNACAIDDAGNIGGYSLGSGVFHAFRFLTGPPVNVDSAHSVFGNVEAIANGASAGWFISDVDFASHALLHTDADGAVDLNERIPADSGWFLSEAKGINAAGQIVGDGTLNGEARVFRLTPPKAADTTPPVITSLTASPSSIVPPNKVMVPVTLSATATDDKDPSPVCTLTSIDSHGGSPSDAGITGPLSGSVRAVGGATYTFVVTCKDAAGNSVDGSVNVVVPPDTTPPVISSVSATPSTIWPPNDSLVPVKVAVVATDDVDAVPVCGLTSITSSAGSASDFTITGPFEAVLRATGGRTYTLHVRCLDAAGNHSDGSVDVVVPPDTTAPVITSVAASPAFVWPPNGKMVNVVVTVSATDNVDAAPQCALTSVTGGAAGDALVTGAFSASVRAKDSNVYSLTVTCADRAGNRSTAAATVTVGKDPGAKAATGNNSSRF